MLVTEAVAAVVLGPDCPGDGVCDDKDCGGCGCCIAEDGEGGCSCTSLPAPGVEARRGLFLEPSSPASSAFAPDPKQSMISTDIS